MSDVAVSVNNLGKMYRIYPSPREKMIDVFGLNRLRFWKTVTFPQFWALRGLNLEVRKGERVGLIGRNGAGKSTLLKVVCGMIPPTEGTVRVAGKVQALMELGTGFHPEFTGRQNIRASLAYQGLGFRTIGQAIDEIVDFAELEDFIDQPIKTYSAGMNARLAFATATYLRPEILIIDEILGAGDAYFAGKCLERMRKITEEAGATVLFVSHDLGSVQRFCSRVVWIERGRIRAAGDPGEVVQGYAEQVRREEDLRLKARDMKLQKAQTAALREHTDLYDTLLFHLVTDRPHPAGVHTVRRLRLLADGHEVGAIDVGAAMDNVAGQLHYLADGPTMDWSEPVKDGAGYARQYRDLNGQYQHAPFYFAVPKPLADAADGYVLEIDGTFDAKDLIYLERYVDGQYVRVGELRPGPVGGQAFAFPGKRGQAAALIEQARAAATSEERSRKVVVREVKLLDGYGQEARVFVTGEKLRVRITYEAFEPITDAAFGFAVTLVDGRCAASFWATAAELGQSTIHGRGTIHFVIDRLTLGRSAYVGSAGVYHGQTAEGLGPIPYHVLDRCVHFQVTQPLHEQYPEKGLALQAFRPELAA